VFYKQLCFKNGQLIFKKDLEDFSSTITSSVYFDYVKYLINEIDVIFSNQQNTIILNSKKEVSRTVHNVQVLKEIFKYPELFSDKVNHKKLSAEVMDELFDVVLLGLLHNQTISKKDEIVRNFKNKFSISNNLESKILSFETLYLKYREFSNDYDEIMQNWNIDEIEKAKLFCLVSQDNRRMALVKLLDQIAIAENLATKNAKSTASAFHTLMNASIMFSFKEEPYSHRKTILEKDIPAIFNNAYNENSRDKYKKTTDEIIDKYGVDYFSLYNIAQEYLVNKAGTGLVDFLKSLKDKGRLKQLGISSNLWIYFRIKQLSRYQEKVQQKGDVFDLFGVKIVVMDELPIQTMHEMLYKIYAILAEEFFEESYFRYKDYFLTKKQSDYKNVLHFCFKDQIVPMELQLVGKKDDAENQYSRETNHFVYSGKLNDPELKEKVVYVDAANSGFIIGTKKHNKDIGILDLGVDGNLFEALYEILKKNNISIANLNDDCFFEIKRNGKYERLKYDGYKNFPNGAILKLKKRAGKPSKLLIQELLKIDIARKKQTVEQAPKRDTISIVIIKNEKILNKPTQINEKTTIMDVIYEFFRTGDLPDNFLLKVTNGKSFHNLKKNSQEIIYKYSKIEIIKVKAGIIKRLNSDKIWNIKDVKFVKIMDDYLKESKKSGEDN